MTHYVNSFVTRLDLHVILRGKRDETEPQENAKQILLQNLKEPLSREELQFFQLDFGRFFARYKSRWNQCNRTDSKFQKKYKWLNGFYSVPVSFLKTNTSLENEVVLPSSRGRPVLEWDKKSERSKRRHVKNLAEILVRNPLEKVILACSSTAKRQGQKHIAKIIGETIVDPENAPKSLEKTKEIVSYSPEEGLSLSLDMGLSKDQYNSIREGANQHNAHLYPSYYKLGQVKNQCKPDGVVVNQIGSIAAVPLQNLLFHTVSRIIEAHSEVILHSQKSRQVKTDNCKLICTWGMDGSSGYSNYKMHNDLLNSDSCIFATTMIPLRLVNSTGIIFWQNSTPQSVRFCRPIRLRFEKESTELIIEEKLSVEEELKNLLENEILISNEHFVKIKYECHMTIIDGKTLNVVTGTKSSQCCPICKASPVDFNKLSNLENLRFKPKENSLKFGISPLHCWIRSLELLLHLSYRIELECWRVKKEDRKVFEERKANIQSELKSKMGLRVDFPNNNSNDCNTARRAFSDYELFAKILNVDVRLIYGLRAILIALCCQFPLNTEKFRRLCISVLNLYVELYSWFYLPATIHKILIHGADIIKVSALPLGMMGEDGAESRNKLWNHDRLHHARKSGRTQNLEDIFFRALYTSDPKISSFSLQKRMQIRKRLPLPRLVLELLEEPQIDSPEIVGKNDEIDRTFMERNLQELDTMSLEEEIID